MWSAQVAAGEDSGCTRVEFDLAKADMRDLQSD